MTDKIQYNRINAGSVSNPKEMFIHTDDGIKWNEYYIETLRNFRGYFHIVLYDIIVGLIGDDGWALQFDRKDTNEVKFLVKVFLDDTTKFQTIKDVLDVSIKKDFDLEVVYFGSVDFYLSGSK